jgi:hypothetical protein
MEIASCKGSLPAPPWMRPRRRVQSLARAELRALLKGWRLVRLPRQAGQIPAKLSQPSMQEEQL